MSSKKNRSLYLFHGPCESKFTLSHAVNSLITVCGTLLMNTFRDIIAAWLDVSQSSRRAKNWMPHCKKNVLFYRKYLFSYGELVKYLVSFTKHKRMWWQP